MSALSRIAKAAAERGLDFMVIGGHAVMAHGFARTTGDIDLMVRAEDRSKWEQIICDLGWQIHSRGPAFVQFDTEPRVLELVDLMTANPETFYTLFKAAKEFRSENTVFRVVSLHHLISLKCHAIKHGHAGRVEKDVDDVIQLVKINHLDVHDEEFREMILKYGSPEHMICSNEKPESQNGKNPAGIDLDLEFPDWSGMTREFVRVDYEQAARYNRQMLALFPPKADDADRRLAEKILVEFVLK